ncbi:MAG: hypothetical protein J5835_04320 [Bacteroidales bacterium]|nr:hypothetical protein [Bacteroidales bacterium]
MKKLFVIAIAVLAAAACSKTEVNDFTTQQAISFKVAHYASQTKADDHGHTSLVDEGFTSFKTNAYFYTPGKSVQTFMADETIAWDDTNDEWKPSAREYYWPKTGYINFFSYAGTIEPTEKSEGTFTYTDAVIVPLTTVSPAATASNILIADAAYGYSQNVTPASHGLDGVSKGVPTLFRHMLAKVQFDVIVDATEVTDDKYEYTATVDTVVVSYRNEGSLAVSFTAPDFSSAVTPQTKAWTSAVWTPKAVENVTLSEVAGTIAPSAVGGEKTATPVSLVAESVVLPQNLATTAVTFTMTYEFSYTYDGGTPVSETVTVPVTAITTLAPSITAWNMNTIYKYHVIIKPNGPVRFDPAVETWAVVESEDTELNF